MRYADAMAEAKREYDAWAERRGLAWPRCACGRVISDGGRRRCDVCVAAATAPGKPPCACGAPVFVAGKCRPCYFKAYNAAHGNRQSKRKVAKVA